MNIVGMAAEQPKTVQIDISAHAALAAAMGNSRELKGSLSNLIRWGCRQDADIRGILFDGVSPEAEVRLLELLLERARARASPMFSGQTVSHGLGSRVLHLDDDDQPPAVESSPKSEAKPPTRPAPAATAKPRLDPDKLMEQVIKNKKKPIKPS